MFRKKEMAYLFVGILLLSPMIFPTLYGSVEVPVKVPKFPSLIHTLYEIKGGNISAGPSFDGKNILIVQKIGEEWYLRAVNAVTRKVVLNEVVNGGVKEIIPFYWEGPYKGSKIVGAVLEYEKGIEVFPDLYSSQGYWNSYSLNFTDIKAFEVYGPYGYLLEERGPGTFILYKIYLPNGKICWATSSLELSSEIYQRIYLAKENYSKSVKGPVTFLQNFEVMYEPLYEKLLNSSWRMVVTSEAVVLSLPLGPLLVINSSTGGEMASLFSDVLPQNYTGNLSGPLLCPYLTEYSFQGSTYIVGYSPGTEYIKAVEEWSKTLGLPPMGNLSQDPGILIFNLSALLSSGKVEYSFLSIFSSLRERGIYVKEMNYNNSSLFLPAGYGSYVSLNGPFVVYGGNSYGYSIPSSSLESAPYSLFPTSSLFSLPCFSEIYAITVGATGPYLSSRYTEKVPIKGGEIPSFQVLTDPAYIPVKTAVVLGILTSLGNLQMLLTKFYGEGYELVHIWTYSGGEIERISPLSGVVWALKIGKEIRVVSPAYIFPGYPRAMYPGGNVSFSDKYGPKYFDYSMGVWRRLVELKVYKNTTYEIRAIYVTYNGSSGSVLSPKSWIRLTSPGENAIKIVLTTGNGSNVISSLLYGHAFSDYGVFDVMVVQNYTWQCPGHDSANTFFSTYQIPHKKLEEVGEIPGKAISVQIWKDRVYSLIEIGGKEYAVIADQLGNVLEKKEVPGATSSAVYNGIMYVASREGTLYEIQGGNLSELTSVIPLNYTLKTFPGGILMINQSMGAIYVISFNGSVRWAKFLGEKIYDFCIGHWSLYVSTDSGILSFNIFNGYLNWEKGINANYLLFSVLPYYSEFLVAMTKGGTIYLLDPRNGEIRGEISFPGNVSCNPTYDPFNDLLYFVEYPYLYSLSLRDFSYSKYLISERPVEISASQTGVIMMSRSSLIAISISKGEEKGYYVYSFEGNGTEMASTKELIYLSTSSGILIVGVNPIEVSPSYELLKAGEILKVKVTLRNFEGEPLVNHTVYASSEGLEVLTPRSVTGQEGSCYVLALSNSTGNFTLRIWTEIYGHVFTRYVKAEYVPSLPAEMIISGPEKEVAGIPIKLEVKVLDKYGNPVPGVHVEARATIGNITAEGITNALGEAFFTYYNFEECYDEVTFYVPGTSLRNSTLIEVLPSSPYKLQLYEKAPNWTYQYAPYQISLILLDKYGNPEGPGHCIIAVVNGKEVSEIYTNEEGVAYFSYVFKTPGTYFLGFFLKENKNVTFELSVKVISPPPSKISLEKYSSEVIAGEAFKMEAKVTNLFGMPAKGVQVEFYLDRVLKGTYLTNSEGTVYVQAVVTKAGVHQATLKVKGMPSLCLNVSFEVVPSPILSPQISLSTTQVVAGRPFYLSVLLKDKYGNLVTGTVDVIIGKVFKASYLVSGEREIKITLYNAGKYGIRVTYLGKVLWNGTIEVLPSSPYKIAVEPIIQTLAGVQQEISFRVFDEYGNPIPGAKVYMKIKQFPSISFNMTTGPEGRGEFTINLTLAGEYDATLYSGTATTQFKILVEPNAPYKLVPLTSTGLTAGERRNIVLQVFDQYNNTLPGISYYIKPPKGIEVENVTGKTDSSGRIFLTVYSTREGTYYLSIYFPEYNKSLEVKIEVSPCSSISISAEIPKTSYSVGSQITIKYEVKDKYGNPVPGVLAVPVIKGVSTRIIAMIKTNSEGTGYITLVPTSKGYGSVYLEYEGIKSNVLYFTVGNTMLLSLEYWFFSYWWTLIIIGFGIFFGILFLKYVRSVGRWRTKLRRSLGQAFRPLQRSRGRSFSPFCRYMPQRP